MYHKTAFQGFTLIELIVAVIILGVLAVVALPKFLNLDLDAHDAVVRGTAGALKSGVNMAQSTWLVNGGIQLTNVPVFPTGDASGQMDFNTGGWVLRSAFYKALAPSYLTDTEKDCYSIWLGLFGPEPSLSLNVSDRSKDFEVSPRIGDDCRYSYNPDRRFLIEYSTDDGKVTVGFDG